MQSVSIVGCGYTGRRLAKRWLESAAWVRGYALHTESLRQIDAVGVDAVPLDLDAAFEAMDFSGHLVYYMVPPAKAAGDPRLDRFLDSLIGLPKRFIYLSTTGVYGNQAGATVDEDTSPAPKSERATRRLVAENILRRWAESRRVSWCILRVAGIYGPGRLPLDRLRRAAPVIVPQEATPGNRIHVTDLVTTCMAAACAESADRKIYNVADGSGDSLTAYLYRVANIAGLPYPPLITRAQAQRIASESRSGFSEESRRIDNRRMLEELGVTLAYADLDAGIRASLAEERQP